VTVDLGGIVDHVTVDLDGIVDHVTVETFFS
jgi:hypothetical protein